MSYFGWKLQKSADFTYFKNYYVIKTYLLKGAKNLAICMIQQTILDRKYAYEHK